MAAVQTPLRSEASRFAAKHAGEEPAFTGKKLSQSMSTRRAVVAALVLLVAASAALMWRVAVPSDDSADGMDRCVFEVGQRWAYRAESKSTLRADLGAMLGGAAAIQNDDKRSVTAQLRWRLDLQVQAAEGDHALVSAHWSEAEAVGDHGAVASGDDLALPLLFELQTSCRVGAISHHPQASISAARTQQASILALSFRVPTPGDDAAIDEVQTSVGTCEVKVWAEDEGGKLSVRQQVVGCSSVRGAPKLKADVAEGKARFGLDDGPWLASLGGSQHTRLMRGEHVAAEVQSEIKVERIAAKDEPFATLGRADMRWKTVSATPSEAQVAARRWPGLEGLSAVDALAEVMRLWRRGKDGTMGAREFARAWLQANPDGAAGLFAAMRDAGTEQDVRAAMFHVVGRFGGPAADKALRGVLQDSQWESGDRGRAALAIAALPKPSQAAVDALLQASSRAGGFADQPRDVGHSSTLALGVLTHEQRATNDALVEPIRAHLRSRSTLKDEGLAAEAFSAIGNSGDPALLGAIEVGLGRSEDIRAKAAAAIRLMDPAQTAELVAARLADEHYERVVQRLAEAAAMASLVHERPPPPTVITAATKALHNAKADTARRALISLLGAAKTDAAKAALKAAFERGGSAATLRLIGTYVTADELMPPKN